MLTNGNSVWVGELDVTVVGGKIRIDVVEFQTIALDYVARYGTTLGTWEATVKRTIGGTAQDLPTPFKFTSSIVHSPQTDARGIATIEVETTVAGSGGFVDVYLVGKSQD